MDPSFMKLLEEDEDETMHSGADIEAFTAALNKDIEGVSSSYQPSECASSSVYPVWHQCKEGVDSNDHALNDDKNLEHQVQSSSEMNVKGYPSSCESQNLMVSAPATQSELILQHNQNQDKDQVRKMDQHLHSHQILHSSRMQITGKGPDQIHEPEKLKSLSSDSQSTNIQKFDTKKASSPQQTSNPVNRGRQIPFGTLLPLILPELDKDKAMQLQTLFFKLKRDEITKEGFVRLTRGIVGDRMLKAAVVKMQAKMARGSQPRPNQVHLQPQNQMQPSPSIASFAHLHQRSQKGSSQQLVGNSSLPLQGHSKEQQHLQFPPTLLPLYGTGSYHPYVGSNNVSSMTAKVRPHDPMHRHSQNPQSFGSTTLGSSTQPSSAAAHLDSQNSVIDVKRVPSGFTSQGPSGSAEEHSLHRQPSSEEHKIFAVSSMSYVKQEPIDQANEQQHKSIFFSSQVPASHGASLLEQGSTSLGALNEESIEGHHHKLALSSATADAPNNLGPSAITDPPNIIQVASPSPTTTAEKSIKVPVKKPSAGQKKPLDSARSSPPFRSKKQKVSGTLADQSIEQLNDVTAVSGVNLREEEEQLFSMPKDDTQAFEASRKVVQEDEEKLVLQKLPLRRKLAEIMTKFGLKNSSNDVERCLSLCVEERLRGFLNSLVMVSRQRIDSEKLKHCTVVTSDVRQQILAINQKAKEEWEKKQAEGDILGRVNVPDAGVDSDKEKEENRVKSVKTNKEEDDKMRTTAANVAARAAVGVDDMLSKWQLMAEQARQKRKGGGADVTSSSLVTQKPLVTNLKSQGVTRRDQLNGAPRGRMQGIMAQPGVALNISLKDVISVLERETQNTKSTSIALYRLYDRVRGSTTDSSIGEPAKGVSQPA